MKQGRVGNARSGERGNSDETVAASIKFSRRAYPLDRCAIINQEGKAVQPVAGVDGPARILSCEVRMISA